MDVAALTTGPLVRRVICFVVPLGAVASFAYGRNNEGVREVRNSIQTVAIHEMLAAVS